MPNNDFPKAILHLDGDAFFVACEIAKNPSLRGKPVVTGAEKRIASAMSYEAKARGITRAMPIFLVKKVCPEAIILPSDYKTYRLYSKRMYEIVRRYSDVVEEYSVDECFADITGLDARTGKTFEQILHDIQDTLFRELGISFSVGLSCTKVLAKIASKINKPNGLALIPKPLARKYLENLPIGKVWGIGGQTSAYLLKRGIKTALDFVEKTESWVTENCSKPYHEIWLELQGISVYHIHAEHDTFPKSLRSTGTFSKSSNDKNFIFSELSRHIEDVSHRARSLSISPSTISFFLKTTDFEYISENVILGQKSALPNVLISAVRRDFEKKFNSRLMYRAVGATIFGLVKNSHVNQDLFGESKRLGGVEKVFGVVDQLAKRFGSDTVFIASSLFSKKMRLRTGSSKSSTKSFNIPFLGRVR